MLLLTDGSIMAQEVDQSGSGTVHWHVLAPDASGEYISRTWTPLPDVPNARDGTIYAPLWYASAVLVDGRVLIAGGEYLGDKPVDSALVYVYDPVNNAWDQQDPPGSSPWKMVGDAPCCVLPDGRVLVGSIADERTAFFDPRVSGAPWSDGPSMPSGTNSNEESWVLLPDGSIISPQCNGHPATLLLGPNASSSSRWMPAGDTPMDLVDALSFEIGPGLTLTDGRAAFVGATGATALYKPNASPGNVGDWVAGPALGASGSKTIGAKDAPACLLPNGRILLAASAYDPTYKDSDGNTDYGTTTLFFEWDAQNATLTPVPPSADGNDSQAAFVGRMLLLPNGDAAFATGTNDLWMYTPQGAPQSAWAPVVTNAPAQLKAGSLSTLHGKRFNGMSQGSAYGDDVSCATNYPVVRLRGADGSITFCRTANHSTMGIATGELIVSTDFTVPPTLKPGSYNLEVVANGIPSEGVPITIV